MCLTALATQQLLTNVFPPFQKGMFSVWNVGFFNGCIKVFSRAISVRFLLLEINNWKPTGIKRWKPVVKQYGKRSSLPSKNCPCISMDMLQIGALVLLGRLFEKLGIATREIIMQWSHCNMAIIILCKKFFFSWELLILAFNVLGIFHSNGKETLG